MRINIHGSDELFTMKEFEKMYLEASKEVLTELSEGLESRIEDDDAFHSMGQLIFSLQNGMVVAMIQSKLFGGEN